MAVTKEIRFSVTRKDLVYDYASTFKEVFLFSAFRSEDASSDTGVRLTEYLGYDFQNECSPFVQITPISDDLFEKLNGSAEDFEVSVSVEDHALGIRKVIYSKSLGEINSTELVNIELADMDDFGFYRGFTIRCFIHRANDAVSRAVVPWSRSNIIFQAEFIVKSSVEEALFEINWIQFKDPNLRKGALYYIHWTSDDVSFSRMTDCFEVRVNNDLKSAFKRLQANSSLGDLATRLIVDCILTELSEKTLRCASLERSPDDDSLHHKLISLFSDMGLNFNELADQYQNGSKLEQMSIVSDVKLLVQSRHGVGQKLSEISWVGRAR